MFLKKKTFVLKQAHISTQNTYYVKFSLLRTKLSNIILHTYRSTGLRHMNSIRRTVRKQVVIRRIFKIRVRSADLS